MTKYSTWERPWGPLNHEVAVTAAWLFELPDGWVERAQTTTPVGLLVGEQPGPSSNPRLPMWPYPPNSAGGRLHRMSGMDVGDYLLRLARVNLARRPVARWDPARAADRLGLVLDGLPDGARVVLCGARAKDALCSWLGVPGPTCPLPFTAPVLWRGRDVKIVGVPHPSGRCQDYNDPAVREAAGRVVRWAAGLED